MKINKPVFSKNVQILKGKFHHYKDWKMDPKGYFLIRVNKKKKKIELAHCRKDNIIEMVIEGKIPQEIYFTAIEKNLLSRKDHAAYLGKELEKAYLALKFNLAYVQDEELSIKKR
jgi:tetrahydromethanopterin S-methyltransferase subunit A